MTAEKVSLAEILERDDGPFWDRVQSLPEWAKLLETIEQQQNVSDSELEV